MSWLEGLLLAGSALGAGYSLLAINAMYGTLAAHQQHLKILGDRLKAAEQSLNIEPEAGK